MPAFNKSQLFKKPGAGGGGGGGTSDYEELSNLPKINDVTLKGNKSPAQLGLVSSVNEQSGDVVLTGADIETTIGGETDTIENQISTIKNDLDDLGTEVTGKTSKTTITLTGESGTLTSAQITALTNDNNVLEIVCDGIVFRMSEKSSSLTYRTYTSVDSSSSDGLKIQAIYVQLNSAAANYGAWSKEELPSGGTAVIFREW